MMINFLYISQHQPDMYMRCSRQFFKKNPTYPTCLVHPTRPTYKNLSPDPIGQR